MSLGDSSIYVVREGRRFLSKLLNCMVTLQDAELVLSRILEPFLSTTLPSELPSDHVSIFMCTNNNSGLIDVFFYWWSPLLFFQSRVTATLYLLSDVLDYSFQTSDAETNVIKSLVPRLPQISALLPKCLEVLKETKSEEMEELLSKIIVFLYILDTVKEG